MIKMEVIAYGATTEEAIEKGCKELGLPREEVQFEVIELPRSKTFGLFGGSPASVRVYVESDEPEIEEEEEAEEEFIEAEEEENSKPSQPVDVSAQGQQAADYLQGIINAMGLENVTIDIVPNEDGNGVSLDLKGDNLGAVIGRRGETLAALQYLVSLAANNSGEEYFRVAINIGNYREKREGSLENLAKKTALRSIKIGRNLALDPMNPYERRIVHTAVQTIEGATSWSVDEGAKRHVVIGPEGVAEGEDGLPVNHNRNRNGGSNRGYGNRRGGYNQRGGYNNRRGGYNRNYNNRGYNRDENGENEGNGGYSRGYNNDSYNRGYNNNRGGRRNYNNSYSNRSNYSSNEVSEPREARKDTSAPLYGRIVPKKKEETNEE